MSIQHNDQINGYTGSPNVAPNKYVTLTGTISSVGQIVTGVGTSFTTEIYGGGIGDVSYVNNGGWIFNGTDEVVQIKDIVSDTVLVLKQSFTSDLSAGTALLYVPHSRTMQMTLRSGDGTGTVNGVAIGTGGYVGFGFTKSRNARIVEPVIIDGNSDSLNATQMLGVPNEAQVDSDVDIDTTDELGLITYSLYGDTTFDISVENSIAGNTDLQNNVRLLNLNYLAWATGAVENWAYYLESGGDGWNSQEQDAIDRNLDYETVQGGELYHGGVPYGRDFYTEAVELMNGADVTNVVLGVNIASPLCPYSNDGATPDIDWDLIDIGSVCDDIAISVERALNAGLNPIVFECGMELTLNAWEDLVDKTGHIMNPGDPENGGAVVAQLLTWTNTTSSVSIITTIRTLCPNALISIDSKQWDNGTGNYPTWNDEVSSIAGDDIVLRQYYQLETVDLVSYATGRARIAEYPDFFTFIEDTDFNGKKTFISQVASKSAGVIKNTFANGLLICELYQVLARESALRGDILTGITHMNLITMLNENDDFTIKPIFNFMIVLGGLFTSNMTLVPVTFSDADIATNCVVVAFNTATNTRISILNPTANTYTQEGISVNGYAKTFQTTQIYSPTLVITDTNQTVVVDSLNTITIRPYSFSVIVTTN